MEMLPSGMMEPGPTSKNGNEGESLDMESYQTDEVEGCPTINEDMDPRAACLPAGGEACVAGGATASAARETAL
jgi:hypothetical protein